MLPGVACTRLCSLSLISNESDCDLEILTQDRKRIGRIPISSVQRELADQIFINQEKENLSENSGLGLNVHTRLDLESECIA